MIRKTHSQEKKVNEHFSKNTLDLINYFILAYAISWAIAIPLALGKQNLIQPILPLWAHYFVGFGPMLSALIMTWHCEGSEGLRKMGARILGWKVHLWWFVAFMPLLLGFVVCLSINLFTDDKIAISELGMVNFLPPLGIGALFLWIFSFGFGEEIGWRGYALPHLQTKHNALMATSILALLWAIWHLPQFFYLFDPDIAIGWVIGLFAGAIVFTWIFNSTNGSILIVSVFHGCFNYITAANIDDNLLAAVVSTIVMVWAIVVIVFYKPQNLSSQRRVCYESLSSKQKL